MTPLNPATARDDRSSGSRDLDLADLVDVDAGLMFG